MGIKPIQLEIAKKTLLNDIVPKTNNENIILDQSIIRISSDTITSNINLPSTANSAVDGYGFLAKTLHENINVEFEVVGIAKAGHPLNKVLKNNQAVEIYTGAKMPEGIDTIAMHENCIRTENKVKKLRELWTSGKTASEIANILGETTRNAVIGKAHRLNLEERAPSKVRMNSEKKTVNNSQQKLKSSASRKSKFNSILLDKNFEPENPTALENLTDQTCKWPSGHPDEENFYFCGRKPVNSFPYCKLHVLYAFQPKGQKEEVHNKDNELPPFIEKKIKSA